MKRHATIAPAAALLLTAGVWLAACGGLDYNHALTGGPSQVGGGGNASVANFGVKFYNVGLGDAILVETPGPYRMLVDGGASGFGQSAICPDLEARGVTRLDVLAATYPDPNHIGGLTEVLGCTTVGAVWWNGETQQNSAVFQQWMTAVQSWGGPLVVKHEGDVDHLGGTTIQTLHAGAGAGLAADNGLVFMIGNGGSRVLLAAEILNDVQQSMAAKYGSQLACNVVKIPAYAAPGFSTTFIGELKAAIAALSVGPNALGYPSQTTLDAYTAAGATIYRTDVSGNLQVSFVNGNAQVATQH